MAEVSPGAAVSVGMVLGGTYEITGLIGKGGMGAVWAARHLRLPKRVAVKVLLAQVTGDSEAFARFRREAEIASRLGHPNIVEVLDFDVLPGGAPYLVLELLEGESLATRLTRGALPLPAALAVTRQIAAALHAAHREGVIHRDLKPENVHLLPREQDGVVVDHVKVLDFGISKIQGSNTVRTQESMILGTPQYMAPEQATGRHSEVDGRTDQFALGAIFYEMVTGRPPFTGQTIAEVIFKVVYEPPPPLAEAVPGLPAEVVAAVSRALNKTIEARFPDVSGFVQALSGRPLATIERSAKSAAPRGSAEAFAETVDSEQRPAEIVVPPPRRRRSGWFLGVGALLVGAAIGVTVWRLGRDEAAPAATLPPPAPDARGVAPAPPDATVVVTAPAPDAAAAPPVTSKPKPKPKPKPTPPPPEPPPEPPTGPAAEDIARLRGLMKEGRLGQAKTLAERLLRRDDLLPRQQHEVVNVLFNHACIQKDLASAYAHMRQLPRPRWKHLKRRCAKLGLEIDNPP